MQFRAIARTVCLVGLALAPLVAAAGAWAESPALSGGHGGKLPIHAPFQVDRGRPGRLELRRGGLHERVEADRLLSLLHWFRPSPTDIVPDNSILREFIGGSILEDFRPWQRRDNGTVLRGPAS